MPKVGEEEFAYTPKGMAEAKARSLERGTAMEDARNRKQTYQIGGIVEPAQMEQATSYKKGGKVYSSKKDYKGGPIDQAAEDKKVQARRATRLAVSKEKKLEKLRKIRITELNQLSEKYPKHKAIYQEDVMQIGARRQEAKKKKKGKK